MLAVLLSPIVLTDHWAYDLADSLLVLALRIAPATQAASALAG